jgi:CDP-ribitol ribitolphosphotransferase
MYRWVIRALYAVFRRLPVKRSFAKTPPTAKARVAFLSRQSAKPSLDFVLLEAALRAELPDWNFVTSCYRDTGNFLARILGTLRHLRLVATSRLCIVDGYTPAVSIPNLDPSTTVVQLWHALGTIKRFGWQAVGTSAGRTKAQAEQLKMHHNYTMVIAGGEGPRAAYAQAFGCPEDKIIPLGMPRMDYLLDNAPSCARRQHRNAILARYPQLNSGRVNILFAPTLHKKGNNGEMKRYLQELALHLSQDFFNLIIAFHPLNAQHDEREAAASSLVSSPDGGAPIISIPQVQGIDLLAIADYVVTDYSAIAFEAALLRRKVLFCVPDIDTYRRSPGLNIDPEEQFPAITFRSIEALADFLRRDIQKRGAGTSFLRYCDKYLAHPAAGASARIARHLAATVTAPEATPEATFLAVTPSAIPAASAVPASLASAPSLSASREVSS